ncbi:MAG: flagellar biosynthesis protein [Paracoccaceae bacterium]
MTRSPALEDFSGASLIDGTPSFNSHPLVGAEPDTAEAARAAEYEQGYQAGWDDATQSGLQEQARIKTELAHNLQDVGFTFHEARGHVMRSLEPLLNEIIGKVFPAAIRDSLAQSVIEAARPMAQAAVDAPIEVVVAPGNRAALEPVLTSIAHMNFVVKEEPTLGEGQVYLQSGKSELSLDFSETILNVQAALSALLDNNKEALKHG